MKIKCAILYVNNVNDVNRYIFLLLIVKQYNNITVK